MNFLLLINSAVIIFLPFYILRFHLIVPTTFLEILLLLAFIFNLIDFLKNGADFKLIRTKLDPFILIFLISAVLAVFRSPNFISGLGILRAYFIEPVIFYYCLVYVSSKFGYKLILNSLLISGIWLAILGLLQKLTGQFTLALNEIAQGRISAVYNSANALALYLAPIAILTLGLFILTKLSKEKVFYLLTFIFFTLNLIWTRSRGGLVALLGAISIITYVILTLRFKLLKKIWYIIPALSAVAIGVFLYLFYLNYNFLPVNDGRPYTQGDTLQIRYFIWTGTINMLRDNPIFGVGLNGFKTIYADQYRLPQFREEFQYPHNLIFTFWAELGIFGLFAFLLLVVESFSIVIRNIAKNVNPKMGAILLGMLSYWLIHGLVDVPYFKNDLSLEFWVSLALIEVWSRKVRS